MQVYKFGGASIATPGRVHALLPIITDASKPLVLVISALGKTTNALERIVELATNGQHTQALIAANDLIAQHQQYAAHLGVTVPDDVALQPLFEQLRTLATIADGNRFDYWYDQIVSLGELFSTTIIAAWLKQHTPTAWADARTFIATDDNYRDAGIDWERSAGLVQQQLAPLLAQGAIVVTQGFIGATATGASVTLGREGSDYTAAVIAAMLEAERVTIWKDVAGLLNADPKMFAHNLSRSDRDGLLRGAGNTPKNH
ncbi:MAG: hypothetical protein EBZ77_09590 [Chitinophagia bacterium]|nr:hypothetical protein [Chitinophagia bacterium]